MCWLREQMRKTTAGPDAGDGRRFISGPLSIFGGRRRMSMGQYEPRDVLPPPEAELPDDYPGIGKRPLLARHYQEADHLIRALPAPPPVSLPHHLLSFL